MKALTLTCKYVNLSYAYDGITIYSNEKKLCSQFVKAIFECQNLDDIPAEDRIDRLVSKSRYFYRELDQLIRDAPLLHDHFDRFVYATESDHPLYHQDHFSTSQAHSHLKFAGIISEDQLAEILGVLIKNNMLSPDESARFFALFRERFLSARQSLSERLNTDSAHDTRAIIQFIYRCGDNDILADLHRYLSEPSFDYLRATDQNKPSWCGSKQTGEIVETSEQWAMIEKTFSLQMAHNIRSNCRFNQAVGMERAKQLSHLFSFFAIPRKSNAAHIIGKAIGAFSEANVESFDARYERHVKRFA